MAAQVYSFSQLCKSCSFCRGSSGKGRQSLRGALGALVLPPSSHALHPISPAKENAAALCSRGRLFPAGEAFFLLYKEHSVSLPRIPLSPKGSFGPAPVPGRRLPSCAVPINKVQAAPAAWTVFPCGAPCPRDLCPFRTATERVPRLVLPLCFDQVVCKETLDTQEVLS